MLALAALAAPSSSFAQTASGVESGLLCGLLATNCWVSNPSQAVDGNAATSATLGVVLNALNTGVSTLRVQYPAHQAANSVVVLSFGTSNLVSVLSGVTMQFRGDTGSSDRTSGDLLTLLHAQTGVAVLQAPQAFDELDVSLTGTVSADRVLNVREVKVLPLLVPAAPAAVQPAACGGCSVANPGSASDQNPETAATLATPAASGQTASIVYGYAAQRPQNHPFEFDARGTNGALSRTSVAFFRQGQEVHAVPGSTLFDLSGPSYQRASATSDEPYDEVRVQKASNPAESEEVAVFEGASTSESTLPVELVGFGGVADGTTARLRWATASETNNAGFVVEQQRGGAWADASALIAGRGTTTERTDYAFDVTALAPGRHTFRLRQIDTDGTVHHSPAATVEIGADAAVALSDPAPNPARDRAALALDLASAAPVRVALYDLLGRAVATLYDGEAPAGRTVLHVDASALPAGMYVVRGQAGTVHVSRRLVVRP